MLQIQQDVFCPPANATDAGTAQRTPKAPQIAANDPEGRGLADFYSLDELPLRTRAQPTNYCFNFWKLRHGPSSPTVKIITVRSGHRLLPVEAAVRG
jgi:hypothetical protein